MTIIQVENPSNLAAGAVLEDMRVLGVFDHGDQSFPDFYVFSAKNRPPVARFFSQIGCFRGCAQWNREDRLFQRGETGPGANAINLEKKN